LTNQQKKCIIYSGAKNVREDEYSHKGIDRTTQIDKKLIESNDYRRKFDIATDNTKVNKVLYDSAKEILFDRSGTHYESMYWIDGETGKIIAKFLNMGKIDGLIGSEHKLKVEYDEKLLSRFKGIHNIVTIHNHPNSSAPSAGDFNSAFKHGYSCGFVVTHNGRVFKYSSGEPISDVIYEKYWQSYIDNKYDVLTAQQKAIEKLSQNADISFTEVLK
jgi:hypothetical protein